MPFMRLSPTGRIAAHFDDDAEPAPAPDTPEQDDDQPPVPDTPPAPADEPTDDDLDNQAYERLKARHPHLFQPAPAATTQPSGGKPKQEDFDTYEGYVEAVADWTADQKVGQVQAVQDTRDSVNDLLADYGPEVKAHARQIMRGWTPGDLAHPNAANTIANLAVGEMSRTGKLTRAKGPTSQPGNPPAPADRMDPELEQASKLMGVKFTDADLKAAGIGGRN